MTEVEHELEFDVSERAGRVAIIVCDQADDALGWATIDRNAAPGSDNVHVHVVSRARSEVGVELVARMLDEARRLGVPFLRWTHEDDLADRRLFRDARAICSRKVTRGWSKDVVVVPAA